jgi:hypothetical protein
VSDDRREDTIAEDLDRTRWDYSQSDDRRFLLDPIGRFFKTFCWDGRPKRTHPPHPVEDHDVPEK